MPLGKTLDGLAVGVRRQAVGHPGGLEDVADELVDGRQVSQAIRDVVAAARTSSPL
jgi:hypothetical protein